MDRASRIREFEQLRDAGEIHRGVCQTAIELIRAGLDWKDLRAAMARIGTAHEIEEPLSSCGFRLPENEWLPLRWRVLKRDNFTCRYCGHYDPPRNKVEPWRKASLCADHIIPLSRGGTNDETNLVCACLPCNSSKNDRLLEEWRGRYQ